MTSISSTKETTGHPIRILLVEDHDMLREGLRLLLEQQSWEVVGEAANRIDTLVLAAREQPDIILLDIELEDDLLGYDNSLDFLPELVNLCCSRVVVLTGMQNPELSERAKTLGASAVVLKGKSFPLLLECIQQVADSDDSHRAISPGAAREAAKIATLTQAERRIITALGAGLEKEQIVRQLNLDAPQLDHGITSILTKLQVSDDVGLVVYAYRHGLSKPQ